MKPLNLLPVSFLILCVACASPSIIQSSNAAQGGQPSTSQPATPTTQSTPTDTLTPLPTATATFTPSPTPLPRLAINPQTIGQLRLLWTVNAAGNGSGQAFLQCQSASCAMPTRISAYAFSPDNSLLAVTVCKDTPTQDNSGGGGKVFACPSGGQVQLYQALTGAASDTIDIDGFPRALAFDPTGKILAVGTTDGQISVWDLASKQKLLTLQHPSKRFGVLNLAFSPDGSLLLSQGDGQIIAWDPAKGTNLKVMSGYGAMAFDPSGQHFVTSWYDGNVVAVIVRIFDLAPLGQSKDIRPEFVQPNMFNTTIRSGFSPDGKKLVILGPNGSEWWDAQGTKMEGHTDTDQLVHSNQAAAFSALGPFLPNGMVLTEPGLNIVPFGLPIPSITLGGTFSCGFALWDPTVLGAYNISNPSGGCKAATAAGDENRAIVSQDGSLVAADDSAGNLRVWGVDSSAAPIAPACLGTCQ